jgi:predicted RNase H-like HicB family nuclease
MTRRVLLYPGEDGYVVAEVPSLPGCVSQGKTRDEALANVREAISLHEEVLRERGEPIPDDNVEMVEVAASAWRKEEKYAFLDERQHCHNIITGRTYKTCGPSRLPGGD